MTLARFLYWCAGADAGHLGGARVERAWYQALGLSVVLTALASSVSMNFALSLSLGGPWWHYLAYAALWALFVFNIDRWLVSTVHYGPLDETNTGRAPWTFGRFVGYLTRFAFAFVLAVIVSEPIVLQIFDREITQQLAANKARDTAAAEASVRARADIAQEQSRINGTSAAAETELAQARADLITANQALDDEISGRGGSGESGCGPRCAERRTDVTLAEGRINAAVQNEADVAAKTATDTAALQRRIAAAVAGQLRAIASGDGFLAREHALTQLTRSNPELGVRRGFVSLLFLLVDLVPLLLKMFGPTTMHDRNIRLDAAAEAAANGFEPRYQAAALRVEADAAEHNLRMKQRIDAVHFHAELASLAERIEFEERKADLHAKMLLVAGETTPVPEAVTPGTPPLSISGTTPTLPRAVGGRWILDGLLRGVDRGGFGVPYLAHDVHRPSFAVVLKQIRAERGNDAEADRRAHRYLRREQELPAKVSSPFVAPILDAGDDPDFGLYLATPYFSAGTVQQRLNDPAFTATLEWALRITEQVLMALVDCLDQANLIHLDIKPSNAALDDDGNIRLIDFGLARVVDDPSGLSSAAPAFTMWYAPPEQIRRDANWKNSAADVRAVAAMLYQILTGRPPLHREAHAHGLLDNSAYGYAAQINMICEGQIRPARVDGLHPDLPRLLADLIERWLSHDPRLRAPGPGEFAAHNALAALRDVQDWVHADGLDDVPVGDQHVRAAPADDVRPIRTPSDRGFITTETKEEGW
jgi:hypothetical protein